MNITQTFYDNMATKYDKLFLDWYSTAKEQAVILDKIFTIMGLTGMRISSTAHAGSGHRQSALRLLGTL